MRSTPLLLLVGALAFPLAQAGASGPALAGSGRQAPHETAPSPPTVADQLGAIADSLNLLAIRQRTGGDEAGPLGRNCLEARVRMRWSDLPCSPDHLPPIPPVPVRDPY